MPEGLRRQASICAIFLLIFFIWKKDSLLFNSNTSSHIYYSKNITRVGLPELHGSDCRGAFSASAKNADFITDVCRISEQKIAADAAKNCWDFLRNYGFTRYPPTTTEEKNFPLAFIILLHKDLDQVLHLLRAIYQPHNTYCLSVDLNSGPKFVETVREVVSCIPNVFLASQMTHVVYSGFTRLEADIHCMEDLLKSPVHWRYVINMAGQQFPLRTNLEMVRILSMFNGTNDVEGLGGNRMLPNRYKFKHTYVKDKNSGEFSAEELQINKFGDSSLRRSFRFRYRARPRGKTIVVRTTESNQPPPHNLEIVKGSAYGSFSRGFVDFVINNQIAKDFLEWCKSVDSPDEYFWATLHHSKTVAVPGRYTGPLEAKKWFTAFASWGGENSCATIRVRGICIFSPEDLPLLSRRLELFANKFYITHHPGALHCLDLLIYNMTLSRTVRDLSYFKTMPFIRKGIS